MKTSLQRRVILTVVIAALVPLLVVWAMSILLNFRDQRAASQNQQAAITSVIADDLTRFVLDAENQLTIFASSIAQFPDLETYGEDQLAAILRSGSVFNDLGLYTSDGILRVQVARFSIDSLLPESVRDTELLSSIQQDTPFYEQPGVLLAQSLPLSQDEIPRLRVAVPVQLSFTERWVLIGEVPMDEFWNVTTRQESAIGSRITVFAPDGRLISASSIQFLLDQPDTSQIPLLENGTQQHFAEYESPFGSEVLGTTARIEPVDWTLLVERSVESIYGSIFDSAINLLFIIVLGLLIVAGIGWIAGRRITRPILQLATHVHEFADNPDRYTPVSINTRDELSYLSDSFNTMAATINDSQAKLSEFNQELQQQIGSQTAELTKALAEVRQQQTTQTQLIDTIRGMSMPVIPVSKGIVVIPLVGDFSEGRLSDIGERILHEIEQRKAKVVLLDMTGLLNADQVIAQAIMHVVQAARLLGCKVILTGIRPELAESLINVGIDMQSIAIAGSLQTFFTAMER